MAKWYMYVRALNNIHEKTREAAPMQAFFFNFFSESDFKIKCTFVTFRLFIRLGKSTYIETAKYYTK